MSTGAHGLPAPRLRQQRAHQEQHTHSLRLPVHELQPVRLTAPPVSIRVKLPRSSASSGPHHMMVELARRRRGSLGLHAREPQHRPILSPQRTRTARTMCKEETGAAGGGVGRAGGAHGAGFCGKAARPHRLLLEALELKADGVGGCAQPWGRRTRRTRALCVPLRPRGVSRALDLQIQAHRATRGAAGVQRPEWPRERPSGHLAWALSPLSSVQSSFRWTGVRGEAFPTCLYV